MARALGTAFPRHARLWQQVDGSVPVDDLSHDEDHLVRVYRWALRLADEAGADADLAGAAALVHDLISVPKEDVAQRIVAGDRSAREAADPLRAAGYADDEIDAIADAVRTSPWSAGLTPGGPLGRVLQDADRLDAIGAVGIARTFACAQGIAGRNPGLRLFAEVDPIAEGRDPDEARYALDHFRAKLLKLAGGMHLPSARREAARRHAVMLSFLEQLEAEVARSTDGNDR